MDSGFTEVVTKEEALLFEIKSENNKFQVLSRFSVTEALTMGVKEKEIENWLSSDPKILFHKEEVLVIGQSISGQSMADILALDGIGNLIIIEIKRDWSNRATVAQLLGYAASYQETGYQRLNQEAQKYLGSGPGLISRFRDFVDNDEFPEEELGKRQRVVIVAPDADDELKRLVQWLRSYGVPIQFVPFSLMTDEAGKRMLISIEGVEPQEIPVSDSGWKGHWILNTNERYGPGAYKRMFKQGVAAIYGFPDGPRTLQKGTNKGDKVFAYVNGQGIRALGTVTDPVVVAGTGIFVDGDGNQQPSEYHLRVDWRHTVNREQAYSNKEASQAGYHLPTRIVFGKFHQGDLAEQIEKKIVEASH